MLIFLVIISSIIFTLLVITSIIFIIFNRKTEFQLFLKSIFSRVWISPVYLFSYPKHKAKIKQIVSDFMYLYKLGVIVKITEIENWYYGSEDLTLLYVLLIGERIKYERSKKKREYLYNKNPFFKYDEDDVFVFRHNYEQTYIVNSIFEKNEEQSLCVYIECTSRTNITSVVDRVAKGFPLQGTLKVDILNLIYEDFGKINLFETLIHRKKEIEVLLNEKIDKKKYAFDIETISVNIENTDEVTTFLNNSEKLFNRDFIHDFSHINPPFISAYLGKKNRLRIESKQT
ncbi:hypothetical protein [Bernardetia sp.]|uniref:hypothetical protein n=1 Tax=Bernardetia sp. TaxID=1937974 RepID=UPI0025BD1F85|nr:hypothetical protein [Bernardetia sp.]